MKRYSHLYEKIFTYENIDKAITESLKNHNKKRRDIRWVLTNRDKAINTILAEKSIVGKYKTFIRHDTLSNKDREIKMPLYFPDQIIHHAIIRVIKPYIERSYYMWSCSCIKGRGTLYASKHLRNILQHDNKGTKYFIQLDIRHYYPSVDHDILKHKLANIFKDEKLLDLLYKLIDTTESGIPIGNYTSQIFANLYLNEIDHFIKETLGVKHYIRYADNLLLLDSNQRKLTKYVESIIKELDKLKLTIHGTEKVQHTKMIDFVGYKHYREHTTIRGKIFKRIRRTILRLNNRECEKLCRRYTSYFGYIKHSNSFNLYGKYIIRSKQWKKYKMKAILNLSA